MRVDEVVEKSRCETTCKLVHSWWGHRQDGVEDDSNSRRGGWWGHRHAGYADTIVFSKLQFISNSATTSLSDSANMSSVFWSSSYDIETGWSWTHWKRDNNVIILDMVPAPDTLWINRYVHAKVLRHLFWANLVMYRIRALSPCCGRLPLVVSKPRLFLLYTPRSRRCLDLGFL